LATATEGGDFAMWQDFFVSFAASIAATLTVQFLVWLLS
jgi:hypothetical protein